MMAEISSHGPISCDIDATPLLEQYVTTDTNDIFHEYVPNPQINHVISVVGYGLDAKTGWDYWIVRNSWGDPWGFSGFFKLAMNQPSYNLAIETSCSYGIATNY